MVEIGANFPDSGGGGSSKFGRFEAALRRAVKLDGAAIGSIFELMPGCCMMVVMLCCLGRLDGLYGSLSRLGGVGSVWMGGLGSDEEAEPGQY